MLANGPNPPKRELEKQVFEVLSSIQSVVQPKFQICGIIRIKTVVF